MHAVVLVGGFGTRLRPLTNTVPKPMLPVVHRPMIMRLVERLSAGGVTDVVLALGFKPEPFQQAFPDQTHDGVRIHYAVEPEPLDTGGAIAFAARAAGVDSTFVVANGDVITDLDVGWLCSEHRRLGALATIHLTPVADPSAFGVVEMDGDGCVQRFVEKPAPGETESNLINAGTYVFEPSVLDLITPERRISVERQTFPELVHQRNLMAVSTEDYWIDTGRPELYLRANLDLVDGRRPGLDVDPHHASARVAASAQVDASVIGADSIVAAEAVVTRSVLLPGASIGERASVIDSIVAGRVGAGATLRGAVIGAGETVPDGATVDGHTPPAS